MNQEVLLEVQSQVSSEVLGYSVKSTPLGFDTASCCAKEHNVDGISI